MNLPSEEFQVGVQKYECHQFERLLDDYLDGRDSISELAFSPHLRQCKDCQNAYDVYLQFDRTDGALLNGGARSSRQTTKLSRERRDRSDLWSVMGAGILTTSAAVLLLFVLASPLQRSDSDYVSSNNAFSNTSPIGLMNAEESNVAAGPIEVTRWDAVYISEFRSAFGYQAQPTLEKIYAASEVSGNLVASRLAIPFQRMLLLPSVSSPWQYTSELPGIRPIHRSVKAGLFLYQDSVSLL